MPVTPTPTSAPSARARAVGERCRDLFGDRADALDQRLVDARRAPPSPRWSRRPGRRARPPRSPAAPSAARPAGRPCRTRRRRSSRTGREPSPRSSAKTCSSTVVPSSENSVRRMALARRTRRTLVDRRRAGLVARDDLDLAAPQARRDLQALELDAGLLGGAQRRRDLRLGDPVQAQHVAAVLGGAARAPPRSAGLLMASASRHIGCSSRGGPGSTTTVGP